jgi:hypothetical protein
VREPGRRGPDWTAIFDRAHRRIGRRLLLLAGIGAAGALLLLSGGLTANGTIPLPPLAPTKSATEENASKKREKPRNRHQGKREKTATPDQAHKARHKKPPAHSKKNQKGGGEKDSRCAPDAADSADLQYEEDCSPEAIEDEAAEKEQTEEEEERASAQPEGEPAT